MRSIEKIKKSGFIKGVLSVGIGNIVGQVITLITLPIISRIYSQEAYGEYGVLVSLTTIFTSFIALGLISAIMHPKDDKESAEIVVTALITQAGIVALLFCVTIAIQDFYKLFEVSGSYTVGVAFMYAYAFFANATSWSSNI